MKKIACIAVVIFSLALNLTVSAQSKMKMENKTMKPKGKTKIVGGADVPVTEHY